MTASGKARAGSLLHSLNLDDLIARDLGGYIAIARELIQDARHRRDVRQRLASARSTSPVFDGRQAARDLEESFRQMIEPI